MNIEQLQDVELKPEPIELPPLPPYIAVCLCGGASRPFWWNGRLRDSASGAISELTHPGDERPPITETIRVLRIPDKPLTEERVRELARKFAREYATTRPGVLVAFARVLGVLPEATK